MHEWMRAGYDKIIMLDDDLRFSTRISPGHTRLWEIKGDELIPEFKRIEDKLGPEFPHVGFGPRQGNNQLEEVGWKTPSRMMYSLGYYLPIVVKECELWPDRNARGYGCYITASKERLPECRVAHDCE
jgi:hypothetical protein